MMLVPVSRIVELVANATPMTSSPAVVELPSPKMDEVGHQVARPPSQQLEVKKVTASVS
jgi:hypothetical protein